MLAQSTTIDFIEELTYRCSARRNYLPPELREENLHPIILEEMAHRDRELAAEIQRDELLNTTMNLGFVPLIPTVTHYVHPAHAEIREPHFLAAGSPFDDLSTKSLYAGGGYDFAY